MLEDGSDSCAQRMTDLLHHLAETAIITPDQFQQGFQRVFGDMTEIVLDVPHAYTTLSKFIDRGLKAGLISPALAEEQPQRYVICNYINTLIITMTTSMYPPTTACETTLIIGFSFRGRKRFISEGDGGAIKHPEY